MTGSSVHWLLTAEEASMRRNPERVVQALVALNAEKGPLDPETVDDAGRRALRLVVESGPSELPRESAIQIVSAVFASIRRTERWEDFRPQLELLSERDDLMRSTLLAQHLRRYRRSPAGSEAVSTDVSTVPNAVEPRSAPQTSSEVLEHLLRGEEPSVASVLEEGQLSGVVAAWSSERSSVDDEIRWSGDAWVVRACLLGQAPIPMGLAESMYEDEPFWNSDACRLLAEGLVEPFPTRPLGLVSAALLNSRLRRVRPRLFLRSPETLVVEPIGARGDMPAVDTDFMLDLMGSPFLRCVTTIDEENSRSGERRPRKTVFRELRSYLEQVMNAVGCRIDGEVQQATAFDPERHESIEPLELGERVVIKVPGLRDRSTGRTRIKALVVRDDGEGIPVEGEER